MQTNYKLEKKTQIDVSRNYRLRRTVGRTFIYLILIVGAIICLLPFYSMIISSTHSNTDISSKFLLLPGDQFIANYKRLIKIVPIWRGFLNSVFLSVVGTAVMVYFSALTAYGFSKYDFKFNKFLFGLVLATLMIPGELSIVGFFRLLGDLHMLNTYWPLILPGIANAFGAFFLKQNCDSSVPYEIIESARMDGCGELKIFHRLVLPLMTPSLATFGILSFIGQWNSFMLPVITLFNNNMQPLPVMVAMTRGQFGTDYGAQYVGIVISVVPIMILFAVLSRKIMSGVSAGALKG